MNTEHDAARPHDALHSVEAKRVLVTGGSRGIGAMIARGLLQAGATVYISSRKADVCDAAAVELSEFGPCISLPADVSTAAGVAGLIGALGEHTDHLDVLVNNAGATWGAPLESYPRDAFEKLLATNVVGVFELTVAALPLMRAAIERGGSPSVINIGSVEGVHAFGNENYAYPASKAAVHMLTRHLALTLAPEIRVNAIAPGSFHTKMVAYLLDDPEQRARIAGSIPLGRIGEPDDIAGAVQFLASRASAYVTGQILGVDGGLGAP